MKKNRLILAALVATLIGLSSCGIFHKGCGCPHFGAIKKDVRMRAYADVRMA